MLVANGEIAIPPESQMIHHAAVRFMTNQHLAWEDLVRLTVSYFASHPNYALWDVDLAPAYRRAIKLPSDRRCYAQIVDEVFWCYAEKHFPNALLWGAKAPIYTLYLPLIHRAFPTARYLHLLRDGRDVVTSIVARGGSIQEATDRWVESVQSARNLASRLPTDHYLELRYEDLVRTPEHTLVKACQFIGVEYSPQMLDFWRLPTTVEHKYHKHHANLASPVFTDSIDRWQERLSPSQIAHFSRRAGDLLQRTGYGGE